MADLSDVEIALQRRIADRFYPNGTATASAINLDTFVIRGWPLPANIDRVVKPGTQRPAVYVSVFPVPNMTRVTTRGLGPWETASLPTATVAATVDPNAGTVTVTGRGDAAVGQHIGLIVDGASWAYTVRPTDTATTIATALAALAGPSLPALTRAGPTLTIPGVGRIACRVGVDGVIKRELEREMIGFMLTVWAPTPELRTAAARVVRAAMAASPRLPLADGSVAQLVYRLTTETDGFEKVEIYRRDVHYWVEFGTFDEAEATQVTQPVVRTQRIAFDGTELGPPVTRIA